MCGLPLQRGRIMYFELVGSHNQLCTFHTLIDLLDTSLFYIHTQHQMIEAARWDKKWHAAKCAIVNWLLAQWCDASIARKSKPANQMQLGASKCVPEHFFAGRKLRSIRVLENRIYPHNNPLPKDLEALWRHREVVLRTGFRVRVGFGNSPDFPSVLGLGLKSWP